MKKGDLIYIPSEVTLYDDAPVSQGVRRYKKTHAPVHALFLGKIEEEENYFKIFYEGSKWLVHRKDILENK